MINQDNPKNLDDILGQNQQILNDKPPFTEEQLTYLKKLINTKNTKQKTSKIVLNVIKIIVVLGLSFSMIIIIAVLLKLYSFPEIKNLIPSIIQYVISALSGCGFMYCCNKLSKWFKS